MGRPCDHLWISKVTGKPSGTGKIPHLMETPQYLSPIQTPPIEYSLHTPSLGKEKFSQHCL
jgi:hypothetical protein